MIDDSDSRELVLLPVAVVESTVPTRYRFAPIHPNLLAAPSMFDHMRSVEKENARHVNATIMATLELEDMPYLVPKDWGLMTPVVHHEGHVAAEPLCVGQTITCIFSKFALVIVQIDPNDRQSGITRMQVVDVVKA